MRRKVIILGASGSVGRQALDFCRKHANEFEIVAVAVGSNIAALSHLQAEFKIPQDCLVAASIDGHQAVINLASGLSKSGEHFQSDVVLNAISGAIGLDPSLAVLTRTEATLALANKESLVAGGDKIQAVLSQRYQQLLDRIIPVDSEHSAIWQCLQAASRQQIERLVLTASGGPFFGKKLDDLQNVTVEQALQHPTWSMGKVITVNSATLMNKALEVIEAAYLFNIDVDKIDVIVHPESIVHSMVTFQDGTTIGQLSEPSMVLPIALGLTKQADGRIEHLTNVLQPLNFADISLNFHQVDHETFPAIELAKECLRRGQPYPEQLNYYNEIAVANFLDGKMKFLDIVDYVKEHVFAIGNLNSK